MPITHEVEHQVAMMTTFGSFHRCGRLYRKVGQITYRFVLFSCVGVQYEELFAILNLRIAKRESERLLLSDKRADKHTEPLCPFLDLPTNKSCIAHCPGMLEASVTPSMPHRSFGN